MKSVEQSSPTPSGGEVLLYEAPEGQVRVDVRLARETVPLSQEQLSQLFGRERSVITKHVRNVFREGELKPGSVCAKFAHTAADEKNLSGSNIILPTKPKCFLSSPYSFLLADNCMGVPSSFWFSPVCIDHQNFSVHPLG